MFRVNGQATIELDWITHPAYSNGKENYKLGFFVAATIRGRPWFRLAIIKNRVFGKFLWANRACISNKKKMPQ